MSIDLFHGIQRRLILAEIANESYVRQLVRIGSKLDDRLKFLIRHLHRIRDHTQDARLLQQFQDAITNSLVNLVESQIFLEESRIQNDLKAKETI